MDRREVLGLMGAGVAGVFAMGGNAQARPDDDDDDSGNEHDEHLEVMARCARDCARAASHCLEQLKQGDSENAEKHFKALTHASACEEFCILSAKQMACESPLAHLAHEANAQACTKCADACEGIEGEIMEQCVASCRECAELCSQVARQGAQQSGGATNQRTR